MQGDKYDQYWRNSGLILHLVPDCRLFPKCHRQARGGRLTACIYIRCDHWRSCRSCTPSVYTLLCLGELSLWTLKVVGTSTQKQQFTSIWPSNILKIHCSRGFKCQMLILQKEQYTSYIERVPKALKDNTFSKPYKRFFIESA